MESFRAPYSWNPWWCMMILVFSTMWWQTWYEVNCKGWPRTCIFFAIRSISPRLLTQKKIFPFEESRNCDETLFSALAESKSLRLSVASIRNKNPAKLKLPMKVFLINWQHDDIILNIHTIETRNAKRPTDREEEEQEENQKEKTLRKVNLINKNQKGACYWQLKILVPITSGFTTAFSVQRDLYLNYSYKNEFGLYPWNGQICIRLWSIVGRGQMI